MNCLNNELNIRTIVLLLFNEIYCIDFLSLHINTLYDNDYLIVQWILV